MIEKFLLLRKSSSVTSPSNLNVTPKVYFGGNFLPKNITERSNQANLDYFNPHLDKSYGKDKIVLVRKDIYYRNIVLFV